MEIKPIDNRMYSLLILHDMHSTFFFNVLDGITDEDAHNRLKTKANHVAWLTGSLVEERCELAKALGADYTHSTYQLFKDHKGIQDGATYPSLAEFKKEWETINPILRDALMGVTADKLDSSFEMMPGEQMSYFDLIVFMTYREANCIGQIALYRRLLGYEAMKYM